MERDLEMARKVQLRLLPAHPPKLQHAEIAAAFLPARSIGGDLYDFLDYGAGRIGLAVGDVSGKAAPGRALCRTSPAGFSVRLPISIYRLRRC